jgi:hypothetical protein
MRVIAASVLWFLLSLSALAQAPTDRVLAKALLPQYPKLLRASHNTRDVRASFRVVRTGNVTDTEILSGPPTLRPDTEENIRSWKFEPATSAQAAKLETVFRYRVTLGCPETDIDKDTSIVTLRTFHNVEIRTTALCPDDPREPKPMGKTKKRGRIPLDSAPSLRLSAADYSALQTDFTSV